MRIYKFDPIDLKSTPPSRFANRISPLRVSGLEPVFGDEEFARKLEALLEVIGKTSGQGASRYSHNSAMAVGENTQPYAGGVAPTGYPGRFPSHLRLANHRREMPHELTYHAHTRA